MEYGSTYYITHGRDIMTPREQAQLQAETAMTGFIAYSKRTVYVIIAVLFLVVVPPMGLKPEKTLLVVDIMGNNTLQVI